MKLNRVQKNIIDSWFNTSNYVYNKTVQCIKEKHPVNFISLRDKLVTTYTKKTNKEYITINETIYNLRKQMKESGKTKFILDAIEEEKNKLKNIKSKLKSVRNQGVFEWETETPKEIRAGAVNDVCKAYKTGFTNLKMGNIKYFNLKYKKKSEQSKCLLIPHNAVKNTDGKISMVPNILKENSSFLMGKKTKKKHKLLKIEHDCRIVKQRNIYWLIIPVSVEIQPKKKPINYCGIDPGCRTFLTTFGNNDSLEYKCDMVRLRKLDNKIMFLKNAKKKKLVKAKITKIEEQKENLINELHWKSINDLLKRNDFIFYGDIKSHDIVKNGKNRTLNKDINNLKFNKFKERLLYKATEKGKKVFEVKEHYTTQTCSFCGTNNKPGCSEIYNCNECKRVIGRDVNAAKNILMKGIVREL